MTTGFPNFVFNSPQDRPALRRVFSYQAQIYDLTAYEAVGTGIGQAVWDMIESERKHQEWLDQHPDLYAQARKSGYILP